MESSFLVHSQRTDRVAYGKGKLAWTGDTISFPASTELQKSRVEHRSHQPYWLSTPGVRHITSITHSLKKKKKKQNGTKIT